MFFARIPETVALRPNLVLGKVGPTVGLETYSTLCNFTRLVSAKVDA